MFNIDRQGLWTVVHPTGEIDLAVADEFRATVLDALSRADSVAIDFSEVTFLDSTGLSVIVAALQETKALGAQLVLVGLSERTLRLLEITGMIDIVDIRDRLHGDEESAVEWIIEQPDLPKAS
jgi:anti-sigma B factor antagonist